MNEKNLPPDDRYPDQLGAGFDWMSVAHADLYRMVNDGMNLESAMSVSATWARLGDELSDLGDELTRLARETAAGWEGDAAGLADESIVALARWARETGSTATEVSGCITMATDNAAHARNAMPPPVEFATDPMVARTFTSGGFSAAPNLLLDQQNDVLDTMRQRHAEAARVMDQFQAGSREVYRTVPQFGQLDLSRQPRGDRRDRPDRWRSRSPLSTTPSGHGLGGGSGGGGGRATPYGGSPRPGVRVGASPGSSGGGMANGAVPGRVPTAMPGGVMGAVPMGMGGAGRGDDNERISRGYLEEQEDIWACIAGGMLPSVPVLGAEDSAEDNVA